MAQQAKQNVEHDDGSRISNMREIINGGAADIHAHIARVDWLKLSLLAGQCVVKLELEAHGCLSRMKFPTGRNRFLCLLGISRDKNGQASETLANNNPANDAAVGLVHGAKLMACQAGAVKGE